MNDLISRRAAIEKVEMLFKALSKEYVDMMGIGYNHAVSDSLAILKNIPPAEPYWIPVWERLPEPNEIEENGCRRYYLIQNEYGDMMVCSWNGLDWEQMYQHKPIEDKAVAWMPLPKRFKGGAE